MRSYYILLLSGFLYVFACKNAPSADANSTATLPVPAAAPIDSSIVSVRAIDFYELTRAKPNMPVIDVRDPADFKTGHIARSVNIPFTDPMYLNRIAALNRSQEYAVYCGYGNISMELAESMKKIGFVRVYHLKDGLSNWGEAQQALQL